MIIIESEGVWGGGGGTPPNQVSVHKVTVKEKLINIIKI